MMMVLYIQNMGHVFIDYNVFWDLLKLNRISHVQSKLLLG